MDPRTPYLSSFRGLRAPVKSARVQPVSSPVGAATSITAGDQAKALLKKKTRGGGIGGSGFTTTGTGTGSK